MYQQEVPKQAKVVKSRASKDRLKGHRDTVISLVSPYGNDSGYLYSASRDGQVRAWDLVNREIASKLLVSRYPNETTVDDEEARCVKNNLITAATFDEKSIFAAYEDGYICSRNLKSGELVYEFIGHGKCVNGLQFMNIRQLVSCSLDGQIRIWDSTSGTCELIFNIGQPIDFMQVTDRIDVMYGKNTIVSINPLKQNIIRSSQFPNIVIMSFFSYKQLLILGTLENALMIYDLNTLDANSQPIKQILGNQGWALCMQVLEPYIYIGTDDKKIKVYDLKTWELKEELMDHIDGVTVLQFSNGMLYSGSYDHFIRSWDLEEMHLRIKERQLMAREDLASKRYDVYLKSLPKKKKKASKKKK